MASNKCIVEKAVSENPGIGFTELQRRTGLATGALQYHIHMSDRIVQRKKAVLTSYACSDCRLSRLCENTCLKKILRDPVKKLILTSLLEGKKQKKIAEETGLHKSTISYHAGNIRELFKLD